MSSAKQPPPGQPRKRKVRSDAVLHALPEEKQMAIMERLKVAPGEVVSKELRAESPPITISGAGLYRFAEYWRAQLRFIGAQGGREALLAQMATDSPQMTPERLEKWADVFFLQRATSAGDLEGYVKLRAVMERAKQTRLDAKRLALLEVKEAKLAAVEQALKDRKADGGLSPETLEIMEEMLGMMS